MPQRKNPTEVTIMSEPNMQHQWLRGPLLGKGSTATVSLAITATSATFAVKSAKHRNSAPLQREQRLLSSIPSSPHIISYLGFELTSTHFNLFLEYTPGGSLSDQISGKPLHDENQIRYYTHGILMGLSHLHSLGFAHCDVKPCNVLLSADGSPKLADFGCARCLSDDGDDRPVFAGTPLFMSPESARGEDQGTASDVWALGCTIIEMATGKPPWPEIHDVVSAVHHIGYSGESPEIPFWVSDDAQDFLMKCFERSPCRRPTADELLLHPFVTSGNSPIDEYMCPPQKIWRTPKCVLDRHVWDFLEDEEEEEEKVISSPAGDFESSVQRLRELTTPDVDGEWMDGEDWITVRTVGCNAT